MKPPVPARSHRRRSGGPRWQEHNSARQTLVLEAAVALLEENAPGAEVSIQQIAERAGLARSVIYRQFAHREDLDAQVRAFILDNYLAEFESLLVLDPAKTPADVVHDIMGKVVEWACDHPNLYRFCLTGEAQDYAAGEAGGATFRHRIADSLWQRFSSWTAILGIDIAPFHPLAFGVVGMVEGVVTQYVCAPPKDGQPDREALATLLTSATWYLFAGHASELGYHFDRTANIAAVLGELFAAAGNTKS